MTGTIVRQSSTCDGVLHGDGFAVIDIETTGLKRGWHHRIVEIAVIGLDPTGQVTDRWTTLVNPQRDMGPQHIHGIRAAEAARAPVFPELAGEVTARLKGKVIVGHNVRFDLGHLAEEFERCSLSVDCLALPAVCTMQLSHTYLAPGTGRSLQAICQVLGLGEFQVHTAEGDASATAAAFAAFLAHDPGLLSATRTARAAAIDWPDLDIGRVAAVHRIDTGHNRAHWLTAIIDRLPRNEDPEVDAYLAALDRAVLDRYVDSREASKLIDVAWSLGLHGSDTVALHYGYLHAVAREALADHVVTPTERADLVRLAATLGLSGADVDEALAQPQDLLAGFTPSRRLRLQPGMTVVITGDTEHGKAQWAELLASVHVNLAKNVSRKTDLVVAADLDTASGKGRLARERGLPVIDEEHLIELYHEAKLETHE